MCYSIESRDRRHVKVYGFLSFAKNMGKNIGKNVRDKDSQKLLDSPTKTTKICSKSCFKKSNSKNRRSNW